MKNLYRMHLFTHIRLFLIICIASTIETRAMELFSNEESQTAGYINITGVDRKELFNALYDHAENFNHQKAESSETDQYNHTGTSYNTSLDTLWNFVRSITPTAFNFSAPFTYFEAPQRTITLHEVLRGFDEKEESLFTRVAKLQDEQSITITSVDGHQFNLKFKRTRSALLAGQVYDTLYVASYDRIYGAGEAKRIYNDLLEQTRRTNSAQGLLSTLKRNSLKSEVSDRTVQQKPTSESKGDDEEVIILNHSSNRCAPANQHIIGNITNLLGKGSFDIFSPRNEDEK